MWTSTAPSPAAALGSHSQRSRRRVASRWTASSRCGPRSACSLASCRRRCARREREGRRGGARRRGRLRCATATAAAAAAALGPICRCSVARRSRWRPPPRALLSMRSSSIFSSSTAFARGSRPRGQRQRWLRRRGSSSRPKRPSGACCCSSTAPTRSWCVAPGCSRGWRSWRRRRARRFHGSMRISHSTSLTRRRRRRTSSWAWRAWRRRSTSTRTSSAPSCRRCRPRCALASR
mmetsp:Transcript_21360/g.72212  ORF Transcript_21360/g.72212 Transcript_21360/m.72212 type:complete len:235 (-) Transcript_21360:347-1051(-)